ncbi:MAG: 4Fe-4S binding protein [Candidatus Bathyarchaeia archaeon]
MFCPYKALFVTPIEVIVFHELCHSCGGCTLVCPRGTISEGKHIVGTLRQGYLNGIEIVYGALRVREPMATPLIRNVKMLIKSILIGLRISLLTLRLESHVQWLRRLREVIIAFS